jgi:hypothetical protein
MPTEKRDSVGYLVKEKKLPIVRACRCVGLTRSAYYRPLIDRTERDAPVAEKAQCRRGQERSLGLLEVFSMVAQRRLQDEPQAPASSVLQHEL